LSGATRRVVPSRRAAPIALALLVLAAACGYSAGPLTRHQSQQVSVPMFQNQTFWRDFEVGLTHEVEKELAARPGISIVPSERADIVLLGTIVDFQQHVLTESSTDTVNESSTVTTVRCEVKDVHLDRVVRTFTVRYRAAFVPAKGETVQTAAAVSFVDLARRIADGLEGDFPAASAEARGEATKPAPAEGSH
jgi:hypothetical protein